MKLKLFIELNSNSMSEKEATILYIKNELNWLSIHLKVNKNGFIKRRIKNFKNKYKSFIEENVEYFI